MQQDIGYMFDRTVGPGNGHDDENGKGDGVPLPLNLIALIVSYLDEPADLARTCRTCRVLHYMTLPRLYSNVSLHAYDYIRYSQIDGRPEGCGAASPFTMALNALATRNVVGYVKKFRVWGKWKEDDLEECSKVGRVPDGSMMLNTMVRVAVDRMPALEEFSWELDTKMLSTVWLGLAQKQTLTSLTVKFPSIRVPRPVMTVPPIPNLKSLRITDIDPLCYPDDISMLLFGSKKLKDLKLHYSIRMRNAREPSVTLHTYFGRAVTAGYKLPLKSLSVQNIYTPNAGEFGDLVDPTTTQEVTFINSVSGLGDDTETTFIDHSLKLRPSTTVKSNLKMIRGDKIDRMHCDLLAKLSGLERYYLVTGRKFREQSNGSPSYSISNHGYHSSTPSDDAASSFSTSTPTTTSSAQSEIGMASLGKDYLNNLFKNHGPTLRHLLLMPQWRLSSEDIARLVRSCPNLEQLGLAVELTNLNMLRILIPFLPRLYAIRILDPTDACGLLLADEWRSSVCPKGDECQQQTDGDDAWQLDWNNLRWVGVGEAVYEIGKPALIESGGESGEVKYSSSIRRRPVEMVKDVEIWNMDRLEI